MPSMPYPENGRRITVGVDTHADVHVAVALDQLGARLGERHIPTTAAGYEELERWALELGTVDAFGVEGTGSYGAGLSRLLRQRGHRVVEVNRPDRSTRRLRGKSDPIDAEMAARAVLAGVATAIPKAGDGDVEMIRVLKMARDSAVKAQTKAINQIRAILINAPTPLREELTGLTTGKLLNRCAALPELLAPDIVTPTAAAQYTLRLLAQRYLQLRSEANQIKAHLRRLTDRTAPALTALTGVGPDGAATFLTAAGDNPDRLHSEAAFAALCGSSPIPASSGKTNRHRLNRGGNRQANAALHRAVVVRLRWHEPTQKYMARRRAEGMAAKEVMRCLKRYIAREVYHALVQPEEAAKDLPEAAGHL